MGGFLRDRRQRVSVVAACLGLCVVLFLFAGQPTVAGAQGQEQGSEPAASSEAPLPVDTGHRIAETIDQASDRILLLASYLPLLAISLVVLIFFYGLSRWVGRRRRWFERLGKNRFTRDLSRQAVQVAVFLLGVLVVLEILDATALVGAVLGTAGVFGLAVGFAFRDLVENYISSVLLSIRQPFSPNDHVRIGDLEGKVVRLTSRATILMTLDGNHLRVPNAQVFKGVILNFSRNPKRRFQFGVGVGVQEDLNEARELGLSALRRMPGVLDDPAPMALIEELGDSNVMIRFYGWVDQREVSFSKVKGESIRRVKTELEEAGMDLPEPIYRVHMVRSDESSTQPSPGRQASSETAAPVDRLEPEESADIKPDDSLDKQIAEDREAGEENLLDETAQAE